MICAVMHIFSFSRVLLSHTSGSQTFRATLRSLSISATLQARYLDWKQKELIETLPAWQPMSRDQ